MPIGLASVLTPLTILLAHHPQRMLKWPFETSQCEVGSSLVTCLSVVGWMMMWFLLFFRGCSLKCLEFARLVPARERREARADFGRNDAPTVVFVLLHGGAKLEDLSETSWSSKRIQCSGWLAAAGA